MPSVISLTSIPPRFAALPATLAALLAQDLPAADIVLAIPRRYRRFPDWDGTLPDLLPGITLLRPADDLGPATKVLAAADHFAVQDIDILFCDDDRLYRPGWHRAFCALRATRASQVLAAVGDEVPKPWRHPDRPGRQPRVGRWRVATATQPDGGPLIRRRSGYGDHFAGWGGVMLRPGWLPAAAWDIPPVLWAVDDIWLSGWLEVAGRPIWVDVDLPLPVNRPALQATAALETAVLDGHDRIAANMAAFAWFRDRMGIWQAPVSSP